MLACVDANGGLGFEGGLPWHVPSELKHFKETTMGKTIGVGSGTKLPPLPGREIVSLSRVGVTLAAFARGGGDIIVGGSTIFDACLGKVDTLMISMLPDYYACDCYLNMARVERLYRLAGVEERGDFKIMHLTIR